MALEKNKSARRPYTERETELEKTSSEKAGSGGKPERQDSEKKSKEAGKSGPEETGAGRDPSAGNASGKSTSEGKASEKKSSGENTSEKSGEAGKSSPDSLSGQGSAEKRREEKPEPEKGEGEGEKTQNPKKRYRKSHSLPASEESGKCAEKGAASSGSDAEKKSGKEKEAESGEEAENKKKPENGKKPGSGRDHIDVLRIHSGGEEEIEAERLRRKKKKKALIRRIIGIAVLEILTLGAVFCVWAVQYRLSSVQEVEFNTEKVKNTNIDVTKQQQMQGYWTVAVFGVDSRDGSVGKGANADVQIVVNIDMGTGDVKLLSVYRDTYLNLGAGSRFAKINEAYADGGPEQAVAALNKNLDLNIEHYATFNWKAVADAISMIGGVDVDLTEKEAFYMNAYITETGVKGKITNNPAAEYIKGPGKQHLDGLQAVAYARLRYMDDDFSRTRRQREVISQVLEKAKKADLVTLTSIIDTVLPQLAFNINAGDLVQLAKGISRYNIVGSEGFPKDLKTQMMGKKGDCVIPTSLASNVTWAHSFLFGDNDYNPSDAVWTYSKRIGEDSGTYRSGGTPKEDRRKSGAGKDEEETEQVYRKNKKKQSTEDSGETKSRSSGESTSETDKNDKNGSRSRKGSGESESRKTDAAKDSGGKSSEKNGSSESSAKSSSSSQDTESKGSGKNRSESSTQDGNAGPSQTEGRTQESSRSSEGQKSRETTTEQDDSPGKETKSTKAQESTKKDDSPVQTDSPVKPGNDASVSPEPGPGGDSGN